MSAASGLKADLKPSERILEAARRLFCRNGIHATGIDTILAEAGTARMTLYNQFGSKEALVDAVLKSESEAWRSWLKSALYAAGPDAHGRLAALGKVLRDWFERDDYFGCSIMNAVAEYPKGDPRLRAIAAEHKAAVGAILRELVEQGGFARADELMGELTVIVDGAIIAAVISGNADSAGAAGRLLAWTLERHSPTD